MAEASRPRAARSELVLQTGVFWSASNVAFSPNGRMPVSQSSLAVWEVGLGRKRQELKLSAKDGEFFMIGPDLGIALVEIF
jgi:hypothetical protein